MMTKQNRFMATSVLCCGLILFAQPLHAESAASVTSAVQATSTANSTAATTGTDVASSAAQNSSSNKMGAITNGAAAAFLGYQAKAASTHNIPLAAILSAMAALAAYQALSDLLKSGQSADIAAAASCSGSTCTTDAAGSGGTSSGTGSTAGNRAGTDPLSIQASQAGITAKGVIAQAASLGSTYNPATNSVTTPTGTVSAAAAGTAAGWEAAGFSPSTVADAMDALAAAKLAADKKAIALRNAGFSVDGSDSQVAATSNKSNDSTFNTDFMKMMARKPASKTGVAGLSKTMASGESIGVAGDNIFAMINRRYEAQRKNGKFLEH